MRGILNVMAQDGRSLPDPREIGAVLAETAAPDTNNISQNERDSRLSALLLVGEIMKAPWYSASNHYGLHALTIVVAMYALRFADTPQRNAAAIGYAAMAVEHCRDLLVDAQEEGFHPDKIWAEHSVLGEFDVMWERRRLVADCAATLLLSGSEIEPGLKRFATHLVSASVLSPKLWGLGAVPATIVRYWAMARADASARCDIALADMLTALVHTSGQRGGAVPLHSPYFGFMDCWAAGYGIRHLGDDAIFREHGGGSLWFGKAMLMMLAKRNLKQTCKSIWPRLSKIVHEDVDLPADAFYDPRLSTEGGQRSETLYAARWNELVLASVDEEAAAFLHPHADFAWVIASYIAIVPYRAWTGVLMWLDHRLATTWYGPGRLPAAS